MEQTFPGQPGVQHGITMTVDATLATLGRCLADTARALGGCDEEAYRRVGVCRAEGSIGAHLRHALDHVHALVAGAADGRLDYDARTRGTTVESDRGAGLAAIAAAIAAIQGLAGSDGERPLVVRCRLDPERDPPPRPTTLERELAFVIQHLVHHNALIRLLAEAQGVAMPPRFGIAASTIDHQRSAAVEPGAGA